MDEFVEDIFCAEGFIDALRIARLNTQGELHLVGEVVIETIARAIYGFPRTVSARYQFIAEKIKEKHSLPPYWRPEPIDPSTKIPPTRLPPDYFTDVMKSKYYANERGTHVTITEIAATHAILKNHATIGIKPYRPPTIADYIRTAPLTIDALALDIENRKLWGDAGKQAILDKSVDVNNLDHLTYKSFLARLSAQDYIKAHAERLGFKHGQARADSKNNV